jgi:SynChlorMet cassette protein ScmC
LAASGGTGKTTASNRLPPPWRSLSDDATLVVRDGRDTFWAHPWPTWSRFLPGEPGGSWHTERATPLKAVFSLAQAPEERVAPVGQGEAVAILSAAAEQAAISMMHGLDATEKRALRLERFNNVCPLARAVPIYRLHLSLTGAFWQEIERVLKDEG